MQADRLADLERMLHLLSGKPIPDNRGNITINLDDHNYETTITQSAWRRLFWPVL
ncbi:DUF4942 domain-containing protein [Escherichia coli]|nr:DUF4942 domain-containing protein [Escherichia coli]